MYSKIIFFIWLFAITVASLINYSSIGGLDFTKDFGSGFWLHIVGYFIAGAPYLCAFGNKRNKVVLIIFITLFLLGVLFEIAQLYVPHRTFNPKDIMANGLGLAGVYICHQLFGHRASRTYMD